MRVGRARTYRRHAAIESALQQDQAGIQYKCVIRPDLRQALRHRPKALGRQSQIRNVLNGIASGCGFSAIGRSKITDKGCTCAGFARTTTQTAIASATWGKSNIGGGFVTHYRSGKAKK